MALRGNLKDFSLADVFQLVQLSGKTGLLRIVDRNAEGSIWFRDGEVFFAQSNWRRDRLGERLVNAQRITPAALQRALEIHMAEAPMGRRLGEILVAEGYITPQVLETFVAEQIQDTIFDLMRWDEGEFNFEVLPELDNEDIGLSVSLENIIMEGSRRLEEWKRIKKKIPSMDMVFKMATAPGDGTFEISLKPTEWALLLLIDGTRSIRDLALEARSTDFDVARVIYGLYSAGLLEAVPLDEAERLRVEREERERKRLASASVSTLSALEPESTHTPGARALVGESVDVLAGSIVLSAACNEPLSVLTDTSAPREISAPIEIFAPRETSVPAEIAEGGESAEKPFWDYAAAASVPAADDVTSQYESSLADSATDELIQAPAVLPVQDQVWEPTAKPIEGRPGEHEAELVQEQGHVPAGARAESAAWAQASEQIEARIQEASQEQAAEELFQAPATQGPSMEGFISTEAYLADLDLDVNFTAGLSDEFAALTGADTARAWSHPAAAQPVAARSDSEGADSGHAADKALLVKIIEGIKQL